MGMALEHGLTEEALLSICRLVSLSAELMIRYPLPLTLLCLFYSGFAVT
jgi:hypothetical protein